MTALHGGVLKLLGLWACIAGMFKTEFTRLLHETVANRWRFISGNISEEQWRMMLTA